MAEETKEAQHKEPTKQQIADWKKKHDCKDIHVCKAIDPDDKEVKKAYFRTPNLVDMQRAAASEKAKTGSFNQSIFENCLLDCHPDIKAKEPLYIGVIGQMDQIAVIAEVSVEKL